MTERPEYPDAGWCELLRMQPGYDPFDMREGYWFDESGASFAIDFIESVCRHWLT